MKRIVALLLITVVLMGCLVSCNKKDDTQYSTEKIPPAELTVQCGSERVTAFRGDTEWKYLIGKKKWDEELITNVHPLLQKDKTPCLSVAPSEELQIVTLEFDVAPIDIFVLRWDISAWNNPLAEAEDIRVNGNTFELDDKDSIYEVSARWYTNEGNQLQGTICYSFYTKKAS